MICEILISALIIVESGGNDNAIGDNGKAFGPLQIHQVMVDDVNRIAGANYSHKDAFNRKNSIDMLRIFTTHYVNEARLGRKPTMEDVARCWNGGPNGYRKAATARYWEKVKQQLERGEQNGI